MSSDSRSRSKKAPPPFSPKENFIEHGRTVFEREENLFSAISQYVLAVPILGHRGFPRGASASARGHKRVGGARARPVAVGLAGASACRRSLEWRRTFSGPDRACQGITVGIFERVRRHGFAAHRKILLNRCPLGGHRTQFSYKDGTKMLRQGEGKKENVENKLAGGI